MQEFTGGMAMQKASKTKREMSDAFKKKYENIPSVFIMRSIDSFINFGDCFDAVHDYEPHAIQEFNTEKNKWQNKKL